MTRIGKPEREIELIPAEDPVPERELVPAGPPEESPDEE